MMTKYRINLLVAGLLFLSFYSYGQTEITNQVVPAGKSLNITGQQMFYSLPRNAVNITFELSVVEHYKGPYAKYSQKYLNITDGVVGRDAFYYEIEKVNMSRSSFPDSSKIYAISSDVENPILLQLNPDGVLLGCNVRENIDGYEMEQVELAPQQITGSDFAFTDLGIRSFITEKPLTLYKIIQTDSTPTKVPYTKSQLAEKSDAENAFDASSFIKKIRKRRFKLLAAITDEANEVHDQNLELMIKELDKLEEEYLALFIGKTFEYKQSVTVRFVPSDSQEAENKTLCWFSPTKGISVDKPLSKKNDYEPVLLTSTSVGQLPKSNIETVDKSHKSQPAIKYGLYQQMPGNIIVTIQQIDKVLTKKQVQIAQKGQLAPLPASYINNKMYGIEFYPEIGMLKRVHYYDK